MHRYSVLIKACAALEAEIEALQIQIELRETRTPGFDSGDLQVVIEPPGFHGPPETGDIIWVH